MRKVGVIGICLVVLCLLSCEETAKRTVSPQQPQLKESLEKANRYLVNNEEEEIQYYITRHQLDMVSTGTGLRYQILHHGEGDTVQSGQTVIMDYVLYNIMGDVVYSSENEGSKSFVVGHGDVESGLDEAVRHLRKGDVAQVIIPSHLGYGLLGDQKRIPERATLVYTLKILDIKE